MTEQERLAAALAYQGATAAPPTMAQQLAKVPSRLIGALKALGSGSSYGSAEPVNAVNDLARANFWRGSVFGVPEDVKQRNIDRAAEIAATFIGPKAKSWNAEANARAVQMEKAGATPEAIWQETGNWKAPDAAWRQEINDARSRMTEKVHSDIMSKHFFNDPLSEALTHEPLYRAYPELGRIKTTVTAWEQPKGSFSPLRNELEASGPSSMTQRSTALHELQHAIQQKEGFARGGSPEMFPTNPHINDAQIIATLLNKGKLPSEAIKWVQENLGRRPSPQAIDLAMNKNIDLSNMPSALDQYRRLAGEAEARATQKRRNLTDEQRRAEFPERSYDVPINELIIRR